MFAGDALPWGELDWPPAGSAPSGDASGQDEGLAEGAVTRNGLVVDDSAVAVLLARLSDSASTDTQCGLCGRVLSNKKRLRGHLMQHVTTKPRPYTCPLCEFSFLEYSSLYRHMKGQHKDAKPYLCQTCGKGFALPSELKNHTKEHRDRGGLHMCNQCGKTFAVEGNLQWHYSTVHSGSHC